MWLHNFFEIYKDLWHVAFFGILLADIKEIILQKNVRNMSLAFSRFVSVENWVRGKNAFNLFPQRS